MTKIFEALEKADLERYSLRGEKEKTATYLPELEYPKVLRGSTRVGEEVRERRKPRAKKGEAGTAGSLYQSIVTLIPGKNSRIVQFQSTQKGEGTSTLVRELASLAATKLKKNVLLLDLNQKAPNQCSFFHVTSELPPLESVDQAKLQRKNFARVDGSSLYVAQIPANSLPPNIVCELPQMESLFEGFRKEFELILIDSPPAVSCAECLLLSPKVDGVVLVVQAEKTRWQTVDKVKERILAQNGNILGVVLNKRRYPIPDFIYNRF